MNSRENPGAGRGGSADCNLLRVKPQGSTGPPVAMSHVTLSGILLLTLPAMALPTSPV